MKNLSEKDIKILFENLCCPKCRNDFGAESITVKREEKNILVCNLKCQICEHDLGDIILNINKKSENHLPMNIIEGPPPITSDDVINAHRFIKGM